MKKIKEILDSSFFPILGIMVTLLIIFFIIWYVVSKIFLCADEGNSAYILLLTFPVSMIIGLLMKKKLSQFFFWIPIFVITFIIIWPTNFLKNSTSAYCLEGVIFLWIMILMSGLILIFTFSLNIYRWNQSDPENISSLIKDSLFEIIVSFSAVSILYFLIYGISLAFEMNPLAWGYIIISIIAISSPFITDNIMLSERDIPLILEKGASFLFHIPGIFMLILNFIFVFKTPLKSNVMEIFSISKEFSEYILMVWLVTAVLNAFSIGSD